MANKLNALEIVHCKKWSTTIFFLCSLWKFVEKFINPMLHGRQMHRNKPFILQLIESDNLISIELNFISKSDETLIQHLIYIFSDFKRSKWRMHNKWLHFLKWLTIKAFN